MEEKGFWRTIRGRRVFIKDGESPIDAFKRSLNNQNKLLNEDGTVNKEVALKGTNPKKGKMNCQRCVPTYNERLKGRNVVAKLSAEDTNKNATDYFAKNWDTIYQGVRDYRDWEMVDKGSGVRQIEKLAKDSGDGAVVQVAFDWNRRSGGYGDGHTIVVRNDNGKIKWEDPQSGNMDYRDRFINGSIWGEWHTFYLRIDDKEIRSGVRDRILEDAKDED